jgi:uroporphyrinogen decarboxylase
MYAAGATVMGVDSATPLGAASALFDHRVPLQGNISVDALEWPWEKLERHVAEVLDEARHAPGHVVNLGHGVPKDTNPDVLTRIVEYIHEAEQ